ncbi:hypothetical protein BKA67DRAFT_190233 [Truncatella angustata]|uniref:Luciferase domain-containing protein n=1 Tax=Truncatella angustata TaxID=152316 RepID=A0A9P8ZZP9_9PEZI|nr:uncharacterized protein BKA67DRAFT_190233 [Truncatella angustata]KAH6657497.1 hypothetical protein BKA67DRAFT_190233 [Truncatella angustata]
MLLGLSSTSMIDDGYSNEGNAMQRAIRQDPMSITLDGPAIFTLATSLALSVHFFQPSLIALVTAVAPILLYIRNDFHNYLKLGPGGTPATFQGYLKINWLRLWTLKDPLEPPEPDASSYPSAGILSKNPLPLRCGPRPTVVGIAPQRQIDQQGPRECYLALREILENHGKKHDDVIGLGTSCFEKHGLGLFARHPVNYTCAGEICHVHNSDQSMHMTLHPDDVREVLLKGWGQRHPLACRGRWFKMPVPRQFVMIYSPRTMDEVKIVCKIIEAAGWWCMAKDQHINTFGNADN